MEKGVKGLVLALLGLLVGLPFIANRVSFLKIPTGMGLNSADWLAFWGGYLGATIGTLAAIIALYATYEQAKRHQAENKENQRLAVLPMISFQFEDVTLQKISNTDFYSYNHAFLRKAQNSHETVRAKR